MSVEEKESTGKLVNVTVEDKKLVAMVSAVVIPPCVKMSVVSVEVKELDLI